MVELKDRDAVALADMISAADRTLQKAACGKDGFMSDPDSRDLVIHNLEHLCESASKLSRGFVSEHGEVPWDRLAELRNGGVGAPAKGDLDHRYTSLDPNDTWEFVTTGLPGLLVRLRRIQARARR